MTDSITSKKLLRTTNQELPTGLAQQGLFITFEGSEGCGKSTQIARLAEQLRQKNPDREMVVLREPGGTALGEEMRRLLQHADQSIKIVPESELLLFAASRAQLVREVIQPALHRGAIVLCDRFFDSTVAYQGFAGGVDLAVIEKIKSAAISNFEPDITFLIDLDVKAAMKRILKRDSNNRYEKMSLEFHESVRAGFLEIAKVNKKRFKIIDGSDSPLKIHKKILEILAG